MGNNIYYLYNIEGNKSKIYEIIKEAKKVCDEALIEERRSLLSNNEMTSSEKEIYIDSKKKEIFKEIYLKMVKEKHFFPESYTSDEIMNLSQKIYYEKEEERKKEEEKKWQERLVEIDKISREKAINQLKKDKLRIVNNDNDDEYYDEDYDEEYLENREKMLYNQYYMSEIFKEKGLPDSLSEEEIFNFDFENSLKKNIGIMSFETAASSLVALLFNKSLESTHGNTANLCISIGGFSLISLLAVGIFCQGNKMFDNIHNNKYFNQLMEDLKLKKHYREYKKHRKVLKEQRSLF